MADYLEELKEVIRHLRGVESEHIKSVPVKETFQGQTVWEGVVEGFHLTGHPMASIAYAWSHETGNPENPVRHVNGATYCACTIGIDGSASSNPRGV